VAGASLMNVGDRSRRRSRRSLWAWKFVTDPRRHLEREEKKEKERKCGREVGTLLSLSLSLGGLSPIF